MLIYLDVPFTLCYAYMILLSWNYIYPYSCDFDSVTWKVYLLIFLKKIKICLHCMWLYDIILGSNFDFFSKDLINYLISINLYFSHSLKSSHYHILDFYKCGKVWKFCSINLSMFTSLSHCYNDRSTLIICKL